MGTTNLSQMLFFIVLVIVLSIEALSKPLSPLSHTEAVERRQELQHTAWNGVKKEKDLVSNLSCQKKRLTLEVTINGRIKKQGFDFFESTDAEGLAELNKPAVIIVPTIEGQLFVEDGVAWSFCLQGMHAIIADTNNASQPTTLPAWNHEDKVLGYTVSAIRTLIDFTHQDERFNPRKINMMGSSLGGITTSLFAGLEPKRIASFVIIVGGGNLPAILTNSYYPRIALLRYRRYAKMGFFNMGQYEETLVEKLRYDPLYFADFVKKEKVMMFLAEWDRLVPQENQFETWKAFGKPKRVVMDPGTHIGTILSANSLHFAQIKKFMTSRWP